mgnify:CR=1 FL=1
MGKPRKTAKTAPVAKPDPQQKRIDRLEAALFALVDTLEGKGVVSGAQLTNIKQILTD